MPLFYLGEYGTHSKAREDDCRSHRNGAMKGKRIFVIISSACLLLSAKRQPFHQVTHGIAPADCSHKNAVLRYGDFTQLVFVKKSADIR